MLMHTATHTASTSRAPHLQPVSHEPTGLIEAMEMAGVVSPPEHNGDRSVLAPPPPK